MMVECMSSNKESICYIIQVRILEYDVDLKLSYPSMFFRDAGESNALRRFQTEMAVREYCIQLY